MEPLESRRLMSLSPLAPEEILPLSDLTAATDVAVAPNGASIVAGVVIDPGASTASLKVWRYSADGVLLGLPYTMDTNVGLEDVSASIDADGDAVVAYQKKTTERAYFVRISKAGVTGAPQLVGNPVGEDSTRVAAVSMDAGGGFFIADIFNSQIRVHAYDASGALRGPAFVVTTFNTGGGIRVDIAARPDGSGAIVAYSYFDSGSFWNTRATRVSTTAVLGDHQVNLENESGRPSVAIHADGSYVVGYDQFRSSPTSETSDHAGFVRRFNAGGTALGQPIPLGTRAVAVDDLSGGGFVAVFSDGGVQYAQRFDASGAAVDAAGPSPISTVADFADPNVATDASGVATLVYANGVDRDAQGPQPPTGPLRVVRFAGQGIVLHEGVLTVLGTGGDDTILVRLDGANIVASIGTTTRSFAAGDVKVLSVHGLGGDDTITSDTSLKSTLHGGAGHDTIFGGDGPDRVHGGAGSDALWGRDGADRIYGEDGVDSLYGNGSNDRIEGGAQGDHIRGNGGRDKLYGNGGNDRLYGGANGDRIYGQAGRDKLFGEGGNDRLYGDDGFPDTLHGGAGADVFITVDGVIDQLFGDGGRDSATADEDDVLTSIPEVA
ncbi:MAG: serralysin [Humisphaera sp.]|nr:serralysin [Humisphaera sp.]